MPKITSRLDALDEIGNWNTSDVLTLLRKNGLDDCCKAVQKRQVDGDEFLHLTEGKLKLWKRDLSRPLTWSLWRFVEDLKKSPEKYIEEKNAQTEPSEELMSDSGSWGTDFEDDEDDDEEEEETRDANSRIPVSNGTSKNNFHQNNSDNNVDGVETIVAIGGEGTSRNHEFRNSLMIFRQNEKARLENSTSGIKTNFSLSGTIDNAVSDSTYTNCQQEDLYDEPPDNESTYANCTKQEVLDISLRGAKKIMTTQHRDSNFESTSLTEKLREELRLRNARKPVILPKPEMAKITNEKTTKKPQKSFLHDHAPSLQQQQQQIAPENIPTISIDKPEIDRSASLSEKSENDSLPRPPMMLRNFDLVANLPTRVDESEDEYEPFDEQIIEQNRRLSIVRVDSKQSLNSLRQNSLESVYKTPSNTSQDAKQEDEYEIYESITETPEDDNGFYLRPTDREKHPKQSPPPLPAKPPNSPSSKTELEKQNERSPDKKSATLPHSGSGTSLKSESRATRPLPPPPDKQSYMDSAWFHNVTREQATALIKDRAYSQAQNGYFLLRPSTSHPNNPLALVLWFKDRVYNVPVRKRPDNRFALGSAKIKEHSFASVEEIVKFYSKEELVLHTGGVEAGGTKLTDTPPK